MWYDEATISPDDPLFVERIEEGLRESANILFMVGPETVHTTWMAAEMGAALALGKPIIAIVSGDTPPKDIPGPMQSRKSLRKGTPKDVAEKIVEGVAGNPKSQEYLQD